MRKASAFLLAILLLLAMAIVQAESEFLYEAEGSGYAHILMGEPYANLTQRSSSGI